MRITFAYDKDERAMKRQNICKRCGTERYQDDQGKWFCPDCILEEMDTTFLDSHIDDPGELKKPYVLRPPTRQISIRLAVGDVELARKLARQKGVPKYQTYMKTLLHNALVREAQERQ